MAMTTGLCVSMLIACLIGDGQSAFFEFVSNRGSAIAGKTLTENFIREVGLQEGCDLIALKGSPTKSGKIKVKYQQTHRAIPVYGTVLVAERTKDGLHTGKWIGDVVKDIELKNLKSNLAASEALAVLRTSFGHTDHSWKSAIKDEKATLYLVVDQRNKTRLAYHVSYFVDPAELEGEMAMAHPSRPVGFVNAHTSKLIDKWNDQPNWKNNDDSSSKTETIHGVGGNVGHMGKQFYHDLNVTTSGNATTCSYKTSLVEVQNLAGRTRGAFAAANFECDKAKHDTYDYANGGYSPMNDVARNTEITVRMFRQYTGHDGPQDKLPLKARVHYGFMYQNAYWDGWQMTIGDGGKHMYPLTTLDIIAHEYGHAFTASNSNLQYRRQSGGMNEAFSDMSGEAAKYFIDKTNDFVIGGLIMKSGVGLRYMCDPPKDGRSIDNATQYNDTLDVHYSSGVYNKAFCLLAQKEGWTTEMAFRVFARANDLYWAPTTDFARGACCLKEAASDLGFKADDVADAFSKVEVVCKK